MAEQFSPEQNDETIFQDAVDALRRGDRARAKELLTLLLKTDQNNATYWVWMSASVDNTKERIYCLQTALQADPQNAQCWSTRGLAYERLGDKTKAVGSYARALNIRPKDEAARSGFARVGGKPGLNYDAF